jgi:hypothetical protein
LSFPACRRQDGAAALAKNHGAPTDSTKIDPRCLPMIRGVVFSASREGLPMAAKAKAKKGLYSVHPSVAMNQKWIAELRQKTGRSLEEWVALVKTEGPATEAEQREWLKAHHGFGTNASWWIAERVHGKGGDEDTPEDYLKAAERYVEAMFAGSKAGLRPLYDRLLETALAVGDDVKACPCMTIVPIFRNHVIAQIKPATRTRIDFGLALGDTKATGRLIDTGGFAKKDRITHRIPVSAVNEIDAELKRWLKVAYDRDA